MMNHSENVSNNVLPSKTIVLACDQRTGSNFLCERMSSTGMLGRPAEYFNGGGMRKRLTLYPLDPQEQLSRACVLGSTENRVFSFKLHPVSISTVFSLSRLSEFGTFYFIYLTRNDLVRQAISKYRASQTNLWASNQTHLARDVDVKFDNGRIKACINDIINGRQRWESFFAYNGICPMRLSYEDVVAHPGEAVRNICSFVEVGEPERPHVASEPVLERQSDQTSEDWSCKFIELNRLAGMRIRVHST